MAKTKDEIKKQERYARKVCFAIGVFGMLLLLPFNWNINLVKTGNKVIAKVVNIEERWHQGKGPIIEVEYLRQDKGTISRKIHDYTVESLFFFIEKGDSLTIYESKNQPYKCYVPFVSFMAKVLICIFFVFIPFIFMIFGRLDTNTVTA